MDNVIRYKRFSSRSSLVFSTTRDKLPLIGDGFEAEFLARLKTVAQARDDPSNPAEVTAP